MSLRDNWRKFQMRGQALPSRTVVDLQQSGDTSPTLAALRDFGYGTDAQDGRLAPTAYDVQIARLWALRSYGRKFLSVCRNNAVGAKGIQVLHSNPAVQDAWDAWVRDCGIGGLPLVEIQQMASDALVRDGEILLDMPLIRRDGDSRLELALRDSLDLNYDTGIEIRERTGEIVWYNWQDGTRTRASEIAHVYHADSPKAVRGITWFKGAILPLQQMHDFQVALTTNATTTAAQAGMFVLPDGFVTQDMVGDDPDATEYAQIDEDKIRIQINRKAGEDSIMPKGTEYVQINRGHAFNYGSDFQAIRAALLGEVAAAFGISYHALAGDVSSANFSSLRHGRLEDVMLFERIQGYLARMMGKVYDRWQTIATLTGIVTVSAVNGNEMELVFPAPEYIEPVKEITADKLAVETGLASRTQIIRSRGGNPEQVFADLLAEREMLTPAPLPTESNQEEDADDNGSNGADGD